MKHILFALIACALIAAGCASDKDQAAQSSQNQRSEKNPEVGMTRDQVIALYGKTDNIQISSEGETWIYNLNMGERFIPFNFGYRPKMRIIQFDKEGKVARWNYTQ